MSQHYLSANCQSLTFYLGRPSFTGTLTLGWDKSCVFHKMYHFEKCCSGHCTWVMLCFCTSRFARWRRRRVFYRTPFTSSMPSVGLQQAPWFTGWPTRPQFCDPPHGHVGTCFVICKLRMISKANHWARAGHGETEHEEKSGEREKAGIGNCSFVADFLEESGEGTYFFKSLWQYSKFSFCLTRGVWWTLINWS